MKALAACVVAGLLALVGGTPAATAADDAPTATPIKHFISLMQENHSFDNYFGTYPGADGLPSGVCQREQAADPDGPCHAPFRIGNVAIEDLGHSNKVFLKQFNGGRMDGFVSAYEATGMTNRALPMGYYDDRDIPYYWNVADEYVLFDKNFTSSHGGSVSNHMFWISATVGNPNAEVIPPEGFDVPTIFDRLQEAKVSWKFYVQNYDPSITFRSRGSSDRGSQVVWNPLLAYPRYLDDPALFSHIVPLEQYYEDLDTGTLPAVSYIVPSGASEHPPGSIRAGTAFVKGLVNGLMRSPYWESSAFMWTYDDWGGWYDHVPPPAVDKHGLGFRAPGLLVSPYARRGVVDSTVLDFTSQLRFIEDNWGLEPLAARDAAANSIAVGFNFAAPPRPAAFLTDSRFTPEALVPKRQVVYIAYSSALGIFLAVVALSARQSRVRVRFS